MNENKLSLRVVSVIVLNDNYAQGLEKTLNSVFAQSYTHIECVVADKGSIDKSVDIIKEKAHQMSYWCSKKLVNKAELIDFVVPHTSGEFIFIMKSGDIFNNVYVIEQLIKFSTNGDLIYGNLVKVFPKDFKPNEVLIYPKEISLKNTIYDVTDLMAASLINRRILEQITVYNNDLEFANEWLFVIKAFLVGNFKFFHANINVVNILVGRHGGTDKLSNGQLLAKEKERSIKDIISFNNGAILPEHHICSDQSGVAVILQEENSLLKMISASGYRQVSHLSRSSKYYYRTLRSKVELINYKKQFGKACFDIPIIINNRNHLHYLQRLIQSLEARGYSNIYILDNDSNYPPLLDFYNTTSYKVFFLKKNVGFCALWDTEVFDYFKDQYYVYTDSDLELVQECPTDFLVVLHYLLNKYSLGKVGLSLLTDDLPDYFKNKGSVVEWEAKFQRDKVEALAYRAMVDTTFALYGPNKFGDAGMLPAFRSRFPYSARHLPWYENTNSLTEEQQYYYTNAKTSSHWSSKVNIDNK